MDVGIPAAINKVFNGKKQISMFDLAGFIKKRAK